MAEREKEGEALTVGLLIGVRDVCRKIADQHARLGHELHELLRQISNPNLHDVETQLTFRIEQCAPGQYGECVRVISVNGSIAVAHAAFDASVREFPSETWLLVWHSQIIRRYEPDKGESR